jgi:protein-disulfide isomerase
MFVFSCAPFPWLLGLPFAQTGKNRGTIRDVRLLPSLALAGALTSIACSSSPSPEALQATLVQHPEILYAVVRAHPKEFITVLNTAAQESKGELAAQSKANERARLDAEFRNPKIPSVSGHVVLGVANAPITIVEYADFQCPYCRAERATLEEVLKEYAGKVRLVIKQTPLDIHPQAMGAALMFEAVALQGSMPALRFYDEVYAHQERLKEGDSFLRAAAGKAGADVPRAVRDAKGDSARTLIKADLDEASRFGFNGTPGFLINGVSLEGAYPRSAFEEIINRHLVALGLQ